ncbi:hypothetical protein ABZW18_06255 [Streptomyces sp. NPDC004647]|uniref:hypothetical protein n=1 Tax=Streptomyces sp. NPDC004647 TaxID=3154671 RepID=UPI0033A4576E
MNGGLAAAADAPETDARTPTGGAPYPGPCKDAAIHHDHTPRRSVLDQLRRTAVNPDGHILFTGATVVTMDPALGVLSSGDVLVQGATIAAVGHDLCAQGAAEGAVVVDAVGTILTPGFVATHRHAWESQLRRIMPDVDDLGAYVTTTLLGYAPAYRPEDMYIGTKLAALTAIDSGITTR